MQTKRQTLIVYTTAVCNLNCSYCYIDKNPALVQIDELLDKSFQGDYYFEFAKKMFPDKEDLIEMQIWGGEPTIRLDRCFYTMRKVIEYFPNFKNIMFSTNFTTPNWYEQVGGLVSLLGEHPEREFQISIQLSIDGPEHINDLGRGKGVTKKFIEHWRELPPFIKTLPKNVKIRTFFKPTLSIETLPLVQTKESVIKYYQFFERFKRSIEFYENENFHFELSIPNTACPSPHTKQDGKLMANFCRITRQLEKENPTEHYFDYYEIITPFIPRYQYDHGCANLTDSCHACGMGVFSIGLLPNNKVSLCHNGFVDLISEYKKRCMDDESLVKHSIDKELFDRNLIVRDTNCSLEEFETFEKMLKCYYDDNSTFQLANLVNTIQALALTDMIDKKYMEEPAAIEAAHYIQAATSYCIRDNLGSSGSMLGQHIGLIKLLLNGAKEEIENV